MSPQQSQVVPPTVDGVKDAGQSGHLLRAVGRVGQHVRRSRIPSDQRLAAATPLLTVAYANYLRSTTLHRAIREDAGWRFAAEHGLCQPTGPPRRAVY